MSSSQVPFYAQAAILDAYIHDSSIANNPDIVSIILRLLQTKPELRDYFFRNRPDPIWATILLENGYFAKPPEPKKTSEGILLSPWDVQNYLYSIADQVPEIVIKHVDGIEAHGHYISQAIQMLCRIPANMAASMVPKIQTWLSTPSIAGSITFTSHELLLAFIKAGQSEAAFTLFQALTTPVLRSEYGTIALTSHVGEPVVLLWESVLRDDYYSINAAEELEKINPQKVVEILDRHLRTALKLEAIVLDRPEFEYSAWWRNAIEETDQDNLKTAKDRLLEALLHAFENVIQTNQDSALRFLQSYLDEKHKIFYRLALNILQRYPVKYKQLVINELRKLNSLYDSEIHHEYFLLLHQGFPSLEHTDQEMLTHAIMDGPPSEITDNLENWVRSERHIDPKEYIQGYRKRWICNRLWMIKEYIHQPAKGTLDSLVKEIGKPEHPTFLTWSTGPFWIQEVSPLSNQELAALSPEELIDFLNTWKPDPNQVFESQEVSFEGLGRELADIIHRNLEKYSDFLTTIAIIHPTFTSSILEKFQNSDQITANDWIIHTDLCKSLIGNLTNLINNSDTAERNWRWARLCIVRLIRSGIEKETHKIPVELLPQIRELLLVMLNDPDPDEEQDRPPKGWVGYNDPLTVALNHIRPTALETLIEYSQIRANAIEEQKRSNEVGNIQSRLENEVKDAFTRKLDFLKERSLAVHSVFGRFLLVLYWLDKDWVSSNIDRIFPKVENEESLLLFVAAWDSYIVNKYPIHLGSLLHPKYQQAIQNLANGYTTESSVPLYLANHLVWEYLLSEDEFNPKDQENILIVSFFSNVKPDHRGDGAIACLNIFEGNPDKIQDYWHKVRILWEWRVQSASIANNSIEFDDEMQDFARLVEVAPKNETIKSLWPLLEGVLPHIVSGLYRNRGWDAVETFLAKEVERDPVRTIQFYRLMREQRKYPFPGYYEAEEARKIIEVAALNMESRDETLSLIDMLARSGNHQYRDVYEKFTT